MRWKVWISVSCARTNSSQRAEISPAAGPRVGILALQGDVVEHAAAFERLGVEAVPVKTPADLQSVDALVIPGGESTTVMKLIDRIGLGAPIIDRARGGMPLWGTCMGLILASNGVDGLDQPTLGLLDVTVRRNAFGRQIASAEQPLQIPQLGPEPFPAIFIRAPWIERSGERVEILARVGDHPVFVRQGAIMGTSFHPELGDDTRVHAYFLSFLNKKEGTEPPGRREVGNEAGMEIFPSTSRPQ